MIRKVCTIKPSFSGIYPSIVEKASKCKSAVSFILIYSLISFILVGCAFEFTPSPIPPAFPTQSQLLPVSGFELNYEPSLWNDQGNVQYSTNCYAYALNMQTGFSRGDKLQPGELSGEPLSSSSDIVASRIIELVEADAEAEGFLFENVGAGDECPEDTYKVALVVDPQIDYHWYRQNSDGKWSHKPGHTEVTDTDASGNVIYNPQNADRDYGGINYSEFGGFFCTGID